jgi:hypothetical protein
MGTTEMIIPDFFVFRKKCGHFFSKGKKGK